MPNLSLYFKASVLVFDSFLCKQKSKRVTFVGGVFDSRKPGQTLMDEATSPKVKAINKREMYECITFLP